MNGRSLAALFIAVLTLVAAGCGGSSSNEASSDTTTTVAADTTAASTDTGMTTETTETTATDTGTTGATGQVALSGKCKDLAELGTKFSQSMAGQSGDLQDASKAIDELAGQVPAEIRPDFQIIAGYYKTIAAALKGVDVQSGKTPSPQALAKIQQIVSSIDSAKVRLALTHIEAWAQKNC